jgi:hypothetical protein
MTKIIKVLFLYIITFVSCQPNYDTSEKKMHAILDLLPVNADTLIAVKSHGGVLSTIDGGENWKDISPDIHLKQITIDHNNILWGLNSWIGIHEADYSRLAKSINNGKSWTVTEFNTRKFFPIKIVSQSHDTLDILTNDNKVFRLIGNNPLADWSFVRALPIKNIERLSIQYKDYKILTDGSLLKWQNPIKWDTLLRLRKISIPFGILSKDDTVFVAAGGYGGYKAYFVSITNDSTIKEYPLECVQALGVRLDSKGRIWTFGDGGIFLKVSDSLRNVY